MLYPLLRPWLFTLEPERAHALAIRLLRLWGRLPARVAGGTPVELMGLRFPNRVGLAGGFDKNAQAVDGCGRLGFGFIEIGTVTPRAQPGQPRPRLFRLPKTQAVINRMGFPSAGAAVVAERLRRFRYAGIVGVNIGKNATTPIHRAIDDYIDCLHVLLPVADYVAVNISSPNTAALRDLHAPEHLGSFMAALMSERDSLARNRGRPVPILLKVSPDLDTVSIENVARVARQVCLDGIIATNTTVRRENTLRDAAIAAESGGLSGPPVHVLTLNTLTQLRRLLGPQFPLIGVGGIDSPDAALAIRAAGADLVQLYTGLIYHGPSLITRCVTALA